MSALVPAGDRASYLGRRRAAGGAQYVRCVSDSRATRSQVRVRPARRAGGARERARGRVSRRSRRERRGRRCGSPFRRSSLLLLPLLARRRFPFAAPAAVWIVGRGALVRRRPARRLPGARLRRRGWPPRSCSATSATACRRGSGSSIVLGARRSSSTTTRRARPASSSSSRCCSRSPGGRARAARARRAGRGGRGARRARRARARDRCARIAVAEERARIARELHDIVAHAVSVMVLQVGAVRHGLPDELADDGEALEDVEQAGRTALAEMRRLLGAMRRDVATTSSSRRSPASAALEPLLDEVRRAGLPVELEVEGEPVALPRALDLSAYRIVQEGLTNVLKHARRDPCRRDGRATRRASCGSRCATTAAARAARTVRPRPGRHPRAGQDLRRRDDARAPAPAAASCSARACRSRRDGR